MYGATASGIVQQTEMSTGMENSKEFVEFNFQMSYTGDENEPIKAHLDIPFEKNPSNQMIEEIKAQSIRDIDIYDQSTIYVAPMFMI